MSKLRLFLNRLIKLPKKILIPGVIILLIILFFLFRPKQPQTFQYSQVKKQDISSSVSASGELAGKDSVNLRFLQGGKLAFLDVQVNDRVEAGQTIAGLDTQALGIALQQADNNLRDRQATVDKVLDDIHLFQYGNGGFPNVGSGNETVSQRQLRTTAEVARDNAADSIRAAQRNFQDTVVMAPFSGIVVQSNVFPGQFIGPSDIVAQVVDDSQIFFDADVDEADIGKISIGQMVDISLDTFPDKTFKGTVAKILPLTSTTTTNATVVKTRISIAGIQEFISGLNGQASIITAQAKNVLTVPIEAVRPDSTVVVEKATGLEVKKVKTGIESDTDIQITEGLEEGDKVVTNPPANLPSKAQRPFAPVLRLFGRGR